MKFNARNQEAEPKIGQLSLIRVSVFLGLKNNLKTISKLLVLAFLAKTIKTRESIKKENEKAPKRLCFGYKSISIQAS